MVETGDDPAAIVEAKGLRQVTDTGAIDEAVAGAGGQCRQGGGIQVRQGQAVRLLRGQVMKAMAGKGNPALVNDTLKRALADME